MAASPTSFPGCGAVSLRVTQFEPHELLDPNDGFGQLLAAHLGASPDA